MIFFCGLACLVLFVSFEQKNASHRLIVNMNKTGHIERIINNFVLVLVLSLDLIVVDIAARVMNEHDPVNVLAALILFLFACVVYFLFYGTYWFYIIRNMVYNTSNKLA